MKEIVLQIDDAAYEKFMGMVSLCPQVQVVSEGVEVRGTVDLCVAGAIRELQESGKIKHPSDCRRFVRLRNSLIISKK